MDQPAERPGLHGTGSLDLRLSGAEYGQRDQLTIAGKEGVGAWLLVDPYLRACVRASAPEVHPHVAVPIGILVHPFEPDAHELRNRRHVAGLQSVSLNETIVAYADHVF